MLPRLALAKGERSPPAGKGMIQFACGRGGLGGSMGGEDVWCWFRLTTPEFQVSDGPWRGKRPFVPPSACAFGLAAPHFVHFRRRHPSSLTAGNCLVQTHENTKLSSSIACRDQATAAVLTARYHSSNSFMFKHREHGRHSFHHVLMR